MEGNLSENNNIWKQFKKIKAYLKQSYYPPMGKKKDQVVHCNHSK